MEIEKIVNTLSGEFPDLNIALIKDLVGQCSTLECGRAILKKYIESFDYKTTQMLWDVEKARRQSEEAIRRPGKNYPNEVEDVEHDPWSNIPSR